MPSEDRDTFIMAVQVAIQIGSDLFTKDVAFDGHEDEIYARMRRHEVSDDWFVNVRSLAYTFHAFAVHIVEYGPEHLRKKAESNKKSLRKPSR